MKEMKKMRHKESGKSLWSMHLSQSSKSNNKFVKRTGGSEEVKVKTRLTRLCGLQVRSKEVRPRSLFVLFVI